MLTRTPWTCRAKPKNPYPPLQQCCRDSRYPGPPGKKIPKPFPGRYPNSRAFHCDVVEKADGLGLTSQIIFHPLLPWKLTRCHIYLNAGPGGPRCGILTSTSECSRRHNHAISLSFFFSFLHMYSTSVPLTLSLGSAPVVSLTSSAGIRRGS